MKYYSQIKTHTGDTRKEHRSERAAKRYASAHCSINPCTGKRNGLSIENHRYGERPYVVYYAN